MSPKGIRARPPKWAEPLFVRETLKNSHGILSPQDSPALSMLTKSVLQENAETKRPVSTPPDQEESQSSRRRSASKTRQQENLEELKERIERLKDKSSHSEMYTSDCEFSEEMMDIRKDLVTIHGEMVLLKNYSYFSNKI
ncbi:SPX domain-containing protein 3-like [Vigna angularis]|uniref:SPX domain-containing protein 3-like n=1 Tax=Phaseolus angularis TaxID=3914 RepID=UPI0022B53BFC|nr:SPX domain-containing protein 3-like [Vigna angularis]